MSGKNCYDLYNDVIFHILHRPKGDWYLSQEKYKKFIKECEDFFRKEYDTWVLKSEHDFTFFLKVIKEYKGLLDKFRRKICINFPDNVCNAISNIKENINKLREKDKEAGFAICKDGAVTDVVEGAESGLHIGKYYEEFCRARNSEVWIDVHNHPSGVKMPTIADMVNLAQEGGEWSCIVTKDREVVCARPAEEAREKAEKLRGVDTQDKDFPDLYKEYARELSSYGGRWRSFDVVDRNVDVVRCEV